MTVGPDGEVARIRTVALLARKPGLLILDELMTNPMIHLLKVITHMNLPKGEGGLTRPESREYQQKCLTAMPNIKLGHADGADECARVADQFRTLAPIDLLLVCNWRAIVPKEALDLAVYAVNIHRGDLPKYPGARPILQALKAKEELFGITAHNMTPEIDQGEVIGKVFWQARPKHDETIEDAEARIRNEMEHMYVPLVRRVIARIAQ